MTTEGKEERMKHTVDAPFQHRQRRQGPLCKCGHHKSDHGDDPDVIGCGVCDDEFCPCERFAKATGMQP